MRRIGIFVFTVLMNIRCCAMPGESCQLRVRPNDEKVRYLAKVGPDESDPCVPYMIYWLGQERFEPAIPVLITFLNFSYVEESSIRGTRTLYPAREALVKIGKPTLPFLLKVIESESESTSTRSSAVEVWMRIYRHEAEAPEGVAALKRAFANAADGKVKQRLASAMSEALKICDPEDQSACQAAVSKH